jgi:hypothetical protein
MQQSPQPNRVTFIDAKIINGELVRIDADFSLVLHALKCFALLAAAP